MTPERYASWLRYQHALSDAPASVYRVGVPVRLKRTYTLETPEGANLVSLTLDGEEWRLAIVDERGRTSRLETHAGATC